MSEEFKDQIPQPEAALTAEAEQPQYSDVEMKALNKGWKPKEEYHGNPDDFVEANDFLRNHTWVKEINRLNTTISKQQQALDQLALHNKKIEELSYKRALEELENNLEDATLVGNVPKVKQVNEEIYSIKKKLEEAKVTEQQPLTIPPLVKNAIDDFTARNNDWFNDRTALNSAMKAFAAKRDAEIAETQGIKSPEDHLKAVEAAVQKEFPSYFMKRNTGVQVVNSQDVNSRVPSVEGGGMTPAKSKDLSLRDLPKDQQNLADMLKKTTKNFDEKTFIKQYKQINGL